jgi:hypothetical protein
MVAWRDALLNGSLTEIFRCLKNLLSRLMLPCVINVLVFSGLKVSINYIFQIKKEAVIF